MEVRSLASSKDGFVWRCLNKHCKATKGLKGTSRFFNGFRANIGKDS
jgi:hypothetical protein